MKPTVATEPEGAGRPRRHQPVADVPLPARIAVRHATARTPDHRPARADRRGRRRGDEGRRAGHDPQRQHRAGREAVPRGDGEEAVLVLRPVPAVRLDWRASGTPEGKSLVTLVRPQPARDRAAAAAVAATADAGRRRVGTGGSRTRPASRPTRRRQPTDPTDPTAPPMPPIPGPGPDPDPAATPRCGPPVDPDGKRDLDLAAGRGRAVVPPARTGEDRAEVAKADEDPGRQGTGAEGPAAQGPRHAVAAAVRQGRREGRLRDAEPHHRACSTPTTASCCSSRRPWTASGRSRPSTSTDPKTTYVIYKARPRGRRATERRRRAAEDGRRTSSSRGRVRRPGGAGRRRAVAADPQSAGGGANVVRISSTGDVYMSGTDRARGGDGQLPEAVPRQGRTSRPGRRPASSRARATLLETIDAVDGDDVTRVFTTRQKTDVVPDSLRDRTGRPARSTKLTNNVDRTPWHHELKVERFQVTRVDGFKFWVKVTTPPKATGKLPALFWIYPREYADQAAYNAGRPRRARRRRRRPARPVHRARPAVDDAAHAARATRSSSRTSRSSARPGG